MDAAGPRVGGPPPALALPTLDGPVLRPGDLLGRTVLVNFWASWCVPCREEMPALQALYDTHRAAGFLVMAINQGEDAATARQFARPRGFTYPIVLDEDGQVGRSYAVLTLPSSYWIDAHGLLVDRVAGSMSESVMRAKAARALASADAGPAAPRSVRATAPPETRDRPVATIRNSPILRAEDVGRRVDIGLALERLATGAVLDPVRAADRPEIEARREHTCQRLVDEWLLVRAARAAGLQVDPALVNAQVEQLAARAGGSEALARELAAHGVSIDDVTAAFQRGALAREFVETHVLSAETRRPPDQETQVWLEAERTREGVAATC